MADNKGLRVNPVEEQEDYRNAVAEIILEIQRATGATHIDIADQIGVSLGTISNAANKKTDLCAVYLRRLGQVFGGQYLDPYHKLYGVRAVPLDPNSESDVLPFIARANLRIAEARCPKSPGGQKETHKERFDMLPDLQALQRELTSLVCRIEAEKAA